MIKRINVLFVSDDFDKSSFDVLATLIKGGKFYYNASSNFLRIKSKLIDTSRRNMFSEIDVSGYDVIFVDYGLIHSIGWHESIPNADRNARVIKSWYDKGIPIIWCGGLGDSNWYRDDAAKTFPEFPEFQKFRSCSIGRDDVLLALYHTFDEEKRDLFWRNGHSEHGKSTIYVTCPFCGEEVEVYIWSFRGRGRRCSCGAKLTAWHAYKRK